MDTSLTTNIHSPDRRSSAEQVPSFKNRYFVCPIYSDEPEPWVPHTKEEIVKHTHLSYFGGIFAAMERRLDREGLTFYITWKVDELPSYGPDVVAVVVGDEWGRYPLYTNRVRAVFKMMGTDFPLEATPLRSPLQLTAVTALKYVRTQALRVPYLLQRWKDQREGPEWTGGTPVPVFDVPIGYVNQNPLPIKPLAERQYDLFFSGSLTNARYAWYQPQYWARTPKDVSRSRLVEAMRGLQCEYSDFNLMIDVYDSYVINESRKLKPRLERSYSELMMDTRICPVPRGTRLETGRLYEAMRYGCVLVTEPLPDRWYLRGMPGVVVHDWSELATIVPELLADPDRMDELHRASRAWWEEKCSEEVVGRYMADKINGAFELEKREVESEFELSAR